MILLQELLFNGDIMISNAQHCQSILWLLDLQSLGFLGHNFGNKFILDENEGLHGVLKRELMLAHLAENGTNVQVNIRWVKNL